MIDLESLKYPIGKFTMPQTFDEQVMKQWIQNIKDLPSKLALVSSLLNPDDYFKTYRPGGWNISEVIHHMADSHMNAFIRVKLALTEDIPQIKPYFEDRWVKTPDVTLVSPQESILILKGLHNRWATLLESCTSEELNRTFYHPEHQLDFPIANIIGMYAWHGNHHLAHVHLALKQESPE